MWGHAPFHRESYWNKTKQRLVKFPVQLWQEGRSKHVFITRTHLDVPEPHRWILFLLQLTLSFSLVFSFFFLESWKFLETDYFYSQLGWKTSSSFMWAFSDRTRFNKQNQWVTGTGSGSGFTFRSKFKPLSHCSVCVIWPVVYYLCSCHITTTTRQAAQTQSVTSKCPKQKQSEPAPNPLTLQDKCSAGKLLVVWRRSPSRMEPTNMLQKHKKKRQISPDPNLISHPGNVLEPKRPRSTGSQWFRCQKLQHSPAVLMSHNCVSSMSRTGRRAAGFNV